MITKWKKLHQILYALKFVLWQLHECLEYNFESICQINALIQNGEKRTSRDSQLFLYNSVAR